MDVGGVPEANTQPQYECNSCDANEQKTTADGSEKAQVENPKLTIATPEVSTPDVCHIMQSAIWYFNLPSTALIALCKLCKSIVCINMNLVFLDGFVLLVIVEWQSYRNNMLIG